MVIWAFWLHCLRAPVFYFPFGHPWPIYFSWAFLALFLTLHSHEFLLTLLGFPCLITLSLILGVHGLVINPLFSLLTLLRACCGPLSLFYITYCPWVCHFSLSLGSFSPIYFLKTHLFISLHAIHYSCHLGLMAFLFTH